MPALFVGLLMLLAAATPVSPLPAGSLQMVLVVTPSWEARQGTLQAYERSGPDAPWQPVGEPVSVNVGRNGLGWGRGLHPSDLEGPVKKEGDGRAPAGVFRLSAVFGATDPRRRPGGLPFLETTEWLECVDDVNSRWYNRIVDRMKVGIYDWKSAERMQIEPYKVGIVVDHNTDPPVKGAGSCIFLHIWQGAEVPTSGCTASVQEPMAALAGWLQLQAHPVLVQLPQPEFDRLRKDWALP